MITFYLQAGFSAAPTRAISSIKNMNIPQQIKDIKLPDLPQAIKDLKMWYELQSDERNFDFYMSILFSNCDTVGSYFVG